MIWSALPCPSRRSTSICTSSRAWPADGRSSTSWMRSASTGASDAKSSASTTSIGSGTVGFIHGRPPSCAFSRDGDVAARGARGGLVRGDRFNDDLAEELALVGARLPEPHQLQQGEQRHHPLGADARSEEHTSELQSPCNLVCRL